VVVAAAVAVVVAAVATELAEPHLAQFLRAKKFRQQSDKGSITALEAMPTKVRLVRLAS
jgi:hypothetical protein